MCAAFLQTRFMNHLGLDQKLSLFAARVGKNAQELAEVEAVPWGSRDPATQACAIIYGALLIDKVRGAECCVFLLLRSITVHHLCVGGMVCVRAVVRATHA
jgi:hypothetical protein